MLLRSVPIGKNECLLLRKPFQKKFFKGMDEKNLKDLIAKNTYIILTLIDNQVTERLWYQKDEFTEVIEMFDKKSSTLTGKSEAEMHKELFSYDKKDWNPTYFKRNKLDKDDIKNDENKPISPTN